MIVFYDPGHSVHNPEREYTSGGPIPYPECADRAHGIGAALKEAGFTLQPPPPCAPEALHTVHDGDYLDFLSAVYSNQHPHSAELVPTTFALRGGRRPPCRRAQAGYYGFDTTPRTRGSWSAARASASSALAGAGALADGAPAAYALCRPPGHHAGRDYFGGYCYLNNAALAAAHLATGARVALIDIDYHHGNGTQDIFYESAEVFFVSLHADPSYQYPLFWGYADERGTGAGEGLNRNFPLPPGTGDDAYLAALDQALALIADFDPAYLVVSAGFDIYGADPLGDWDITQAGITRVGARIAAAGRPTLLVQEGGYNLAALGANTRRLLEPFATG